MYTDFLKIDSETEFINFNNFYNYYYYNQAIDAAIDVVLSCNGFISRAEKEYKNK